MSNPTQPTPAKEYRYYSHYRPVASICMSLPKGWKLIDERTLALPTQMDRQLMANLELEPLDPNDPINVRKRYEAWKSELTDTYVEKNAVKFVTPTAIYVVHQAIKKPGYDFQVSAFTPTLTATGHELFDDFDDMAQYVYNISGAAAQIPPE